jgi:hypothetical protein
MDTKGKKTAVAIHAEITREIDGLLRVLFNGQRKTGHLDLEATEMMLRSAMHRVGAAGLNALLQFPVPPDEQLTVPCSCGHTAQYLELRSKSVLTPSVQPKYCVPTTCVRIATTVSFRPMSNSI